MLIAHNLWKVHVYHICRDLPNHRRALANVFETFAQTSAYRRSLVSKRIRR